MSGQANVFGQQDPTGQQEQQEPLANQPQSENLFSDQLSQIKAEDGRQKYDTVEKALTALAHSQTLIPTLQQKNSAQETEINKLREELAKHKGVQEVVDSLTNHQQQHGQEETPQGASLGEGELIKLIENVLNKEQQKKTVESNVSMVQNALKEAFGDQTVKVVQEKAKELNTTPEALGALAEKQPNVVLSLFQAKPRITPTNVGSINLGIPKPQHEELQKPEKSLLSGASTSDQVEYLKKVRADVYKRLGVTE